MYHPHGITDKDIPRNAIPQELLTKMRPIRTRLAGLFALAALTGSIAITHAPIAAAQPKAAAAAKAEKNEAKKAYVAGNKAFKDEKYAEALPHFQKADQLYPGAAPKHKIAICYDKLGKTDEAIAAYKAFLDAKPSEKYADRITEANKRIGELEATLSATVMVVVAPEGTPAQITVDGEPVTGNELTLSAGEHTIVVSAEGFQPVTEVVTVKGGEKKDLPLTLVAAVAPPPVEPATPPPPPPGDDAGDGGSSNIPAYVTLGIAGAGVVLGTVFGIQALGKKGDFDDDPNVDNADDAERAALIADMSFGVALTFGITGAVLLFSGGDDDGGDEEEAATVVPKLTPLAGPKGGGMAATWKF
jgi:PEGA domain/Tetratricopeptide repeat